MGDVIDLDEYRKKRASENRAAGGRGRRKGATPDRTAAKDVKDRSGLAAGDIPEDEPA
jgi:hypothetical protein